MNTSHQNRKPSAWLRVQQIELLLDMLRGIDNNAEFYALPELPQALLDRLDAIEFEHLGPIAVPIGEMTHDYDGGDDERLQGYDDIPLRFHRELSAHRFTCEARYSAGACGYLHLYSSPTKPNVLYLLESDGESGTWFGTRFGHFVN